MACDNISYVVITITIVTMIIMNVSITIISMIVICVCVNTQPTHADDNCRLSQRSENTQAREKSRALARCARSLPLMMTSPRRPAIQGTPGSVRVLRESASQYSIHGSARVYAVVLHRNNR